MTTRLAVLACYFIVVLALGLLAKSRLKDNPTQYFLAGRGLRTFVLIGTMAATNFSAFTVFGASGAGYRDGLAFFPIMAFGTGFMALTFWIIGRRVWEWGRREDLVTPAELVGAIYRHRGLSSLFALVLVVYTVPYLALQPLAGGLVLNELFGLPQWAGAGLVTLVIVAYTMRGGLKAVAWTDVFQGLIMVGLMLAALVAVAGAEGGLAEAFGRVHAQHPELYSRPGGQGRYLPGVWFSYILLWFYCDPMFPQLFQRFYSAKSPRGLARTVLWYPAICTLVFALPILLGLLGRLEFSGLIGKEADNILPLLATRIGGDLLGTCILAAGLAALMSTMDSQLLTLSSIFTRDLLPLVIGRREASPLWGRGFVLVLALAGLALAVNPPASILQIATWAFTGFAVLFPTVLFGLYLPQPRAAAGLLSILAGQALTLAYALGWLPAPGGVLPAVPVMALATAAYLAAHSLLGSSWRPQVSGRAWLFAAVFAAIFAAGQDYWRWGRVGEFWLGLPLWAWYFVGLSAVQTAAAWCWLRPGRAGREE
ncbi:MAG: sodium:solute symporter family protein [Pseudomonadota bacterium]